MSITEAILDELLEELMPIEEGSGVFMKQLRSGPVYTCRCPECGSFHGGFRDKQEAFNNLKCRRCYGREVEKKKKDIEKVDEPEKQKDIFKHPLKSNVIEAIEDDDMKDVVLPPERQAVNLSSEIWHNRDLLRRAFSWLTRIGAAPKYGSVPVGYYQQDMMVAIDRIVNTCHEKGASPKWLRFSQGVIYGYKPGTNQWISIIRITNMMGRQCMEPIRENLEDDDFKDLDSGSALGDVNKEVCLNASHGDIFWEKATGRRFRVISRCKTWKTRPNEYRITVKFGLFQTFHVTERNANQFTTIPPANARGW